MTCRGLLAESIPTLAIKDGYFIDVSDIFLLALNTETLVDPLPKYTPI